MLRSSAACSHRLGAIILRGLARQGALASSLYSLTHQPQRISFQLWAMATALRWGLLHRLALAFRVGSGFGSPLPKGDKLAFASRILACCLQIRLCSHKNDALKNLQGMEQEFQKEKQEGPNKRLAADARFACAAEGRAIRLS